MIVKYRIPTALIEYSLPTVLLEYSLHNIRATAGGQLDGSFSLYDAVHYAAVKIHFRFG